MGYKGNTKFLDAGRQKLLTRCIFNSHKNHVVLPTMRDVTKIIGALLVATALTACSEGVNGPNINTAPVQKEVVPEASQNGAAPSTSVQKLTYKVGPFSLASGQKAQVMWESPGSINFQTDEPLWITAFESNIEDGNGGELPPELLHLAVLTNGAEKNTLCTDKEVSNPFAAVTSVTKEIKLPDGDGYAVTPNDQLDAKVILQNPTTQDFTNVYFKFTVTAVPMKSAKGMRDVVPMLLNVDPCDYLPITVAPKEFVKKRATFVVPESGLLTKAYGLLQDYGVEVSLSEKDKPTPFWEAKAELSSDHKVVSIPAFEDPAGIPLKAGDEIALDVAYDNSSEQWQSGAVGAVMAYMVRTDGENATTKKETAPTTSAVSAAKMLIE